MNSIELKGRLANKYTVGKGLFFVMMDAVAVAPCTKWTREMVETKVGEGIAMGPRKKEKNTDDEGKIQNDMNTEGTQPAAQQVVKKTTKGSPLGQEPTVTAPAACVVKDFSTLLAICHECQQQQEQSAAATTSSPIAPPVLCRVNIAVAKEFNPVINGTPIMSLDASVNQVTSTLNKYWHVGDLVTVSCVGDRLTGNPVGLELQVMEKMEGWSYVRPPPPQPPQYVVDVLHKAWLAKKQKLIENGVDIQKEAENAGSAEAKDTNGDVIANKRRYQGSTAMSEEVAMKHEARKKKNQEVAERLLDNYHGNGRSDDVDAAVFKRKRDATTTSKDHDHSHDEDDSDPDIDHDAPHGGGDAAEGGPATTNNPHGQKYRKGKAPKSHRAAIFADFVKEHILKKLDDRKQGNNNGVAHHHVVDVAGGKGYVAGALLGVSANKKDIAKRKKKMKKEEEHEGSEQVAVVAAQGEEVEHTTTVVEEETTTNNSSNLKCTVIDPWTRGPLLQKLAETPGGRCNVIAAALGEEFMASEQGVQLFSSTGSDITCSAVVGMHPDQATEPIVDAALKFKLPFAIVPCCVFPSENLHRRTYPEGDLVETTPQFVEFLKRKVILAADQMKRAASPTSDGVEKIPSNIEDGRETTETHELSCPYGEIIDTHLGFGGRDRVLAWIPPPS